MMAKLVDADAVTPKQARAARRALMKAVRPWMRADEVGALERQALSCREMRRALSDRGMMMTRKMLGMDGGMPEAPVHYALGYLLTGEEWEDIENEEDRDALREAWFRIMQYEARLRDDPDECRLRDV